MSNLLYAPNAEQAVIAGIFRSDDPARTILKLKIGVELFTIPAYRHALAAIIQVMAEELPLDYATLEQHLGSDDLADLNSAVHTVVSDAHLAVHARMLNECYGRRHQKELRDRASQMLLAEAPDLNMVQELLTAAADPALAGAYSREREASQLTLIQGSQVQPVAVRWLWPGWLAAGKMHLMAGPTGVGKTVVAMKMAATLTRGERWPSGEPAEPMNVVIWSGEDDYGDTLAPRLIACGADMDRVFFIERVSAGGERRAFDPATDMDLLLAQVHRVRQVGLVIIDPLVSAVSGDSHKNGEVRRALQPLVDLAASTKAACLGISHFAKSSTGRDPVDRVVGSLAFAALARIVMAATKVSEEQGGGRMLIRAKSNIGLDTDGYRYTIQQAKLPDHPDVEASWCQWGESVKGDARTLLDSAEALTDPEERSERDEAKDFLLTVLADGPVSAKQVKREADENCYAWITIRRAQKALCIVSEKSGMKGEWRWSLPPKDANTPSKMLTSPEDAHISQSRKSEHLRPEMSIFGDPLHSSAAESDVLTLVNHLRNGGGGLNSLTLQKTLDWDPERWQIAKNAALQQKQIYCQAGGWFVEEVRP